MAIKSDVGHLGVILDGNRRFARRLMVEPWKGHEYGAKKVDSLMSWAKELGIKELTLYAFSIENFNRPKHEFDYLMKIFENEFSALLKNKKLEKNKIRMRFIGRIDMFPKQVSEKMKMLVEKTKNYKGFFVNFAMAYGGRSEIVDAAKKIAELAKQGKIDPRKLTEDEFAKYLYMADEPDMIIRTSGQMRTSNFLPYQSTYSEWFFLEKMWPEFEKKDLIKCIDDFKQRKRTFGK